MDKYQYVKLVPGDKVFLSPDTPNEQLENIKKAKFFEIKEQYSTPKKNKWWQFWKKKQLPIFLGYEVTYIGENFNGVIKL